MFVAERASPYRIGLVRQLANGSFASYETFVSSFMKRNSTDKFAAAARPVDVQQAPDGAMLMSDDLRGTILRFTYT
jgi:glucose/arabinose dehydrogenase